MANEERYGSELDQLIDLVEPLCPIGRIKALGRMEAVTAMREVLETMQAEIAMLRNALTLYADYGNPPALWQPCEDNGENGLFRYFITGTNHPNRIARNVLELPK